MNAVDAGVVDLGALKSRLMTIVEGNRKVFAELIALHGYSAQMEAAAGSHPVLAQLKQAFTQEIATHLMGFTLTVEPEPGTVVSGEVVKVRLTETNGPQGAELHVITRTTDHTVNEFRIPLEVLDAAGVITVSTSKAPRKLH